MVRRKASSAVRTIKQRVHDGLVEFTQHAFEEEMVDEQILKADVDRAVILGSLVARQTRGGRGTRYVFRGPTVDGRKIEVVCRIMPKKVRIVTVYRV